MNAAVSERVDGFVMDPLETLVAHHRSPVGRVTARRTALGGILVRRAAQAVGVALLVSVLCFVVVRRLPGDVAYRIAAGRYGDDLVDQEAAAAVREPSSASTGRRGTSSATGWLDLVQLDLGRSLVTVAPGGRGGRLLPARHAAARRRR